MQNSLRKKPTFNELINYLQNDQPKIKYPDRTATFLRNSHYLSQFDGNLFDVEEQQTNTTKAQLRETEIRNLAQTQGTASLLRDDAAQEQNRRTTEKATRSIGTQKRSLKQITKGTQAEPRMRSGETQTDGQTQSGGTQTELEIFDMAADDKADEILEQVDAVMEEARKAEERKNQNI